MRVHVYVTYYGRAVLLTEAGRDANASSATPVANARHFHSLIREEPPGDLQPTSLAMQIEISLGLSYSAPTRGANNTTGRKLFSIHLYSDFNCSIWWENSFVPEDFIEL